MSRKAQLLAAPLEKLFQLYYRCQKRPVFGQFEYCLGGNTRVINFDARNLAFDIFYSDLFEENYEDETAVLMDTFLSSGDCFYDIGSNWGYFSLYAASGGAQIRVHAFEPIPATYQDLLSCVEQAGLRSVVQCHMFAISDSDGRLRFDLPFHSASAQVAGHDRGVEVQTKRIDSMELEDPTFIKIDAEGHEGAVVRGSLATIRRSEPFIMFENKVYPDLAEKTLDPLCALKRLGYSLFVPAVERKSRAVSYLATCGYQIATASMQRIHRDDVLTLVPLEPEFRFLYPPFLNIFACPSGRIPQLKAKFQPWAAAELDCSPS